MTALYDRRYVAQRHGIVGWYHAWMAGRRVALIQRMAPFRPGARILEIGCDTGDLLRELEAVGGTVLGIDLNPQAVRVAHHPRLAVARAEALPYPERCFDLCVASHVVEHLPDPQRFLAEVARVLVPSGAAVLWYPLELFRGMCVLPELLVSGRRLSLAREYHLHVLRPGHLREMAAASGLSFRSWRWCVYGPIPEFVSVLASEPGRAGLTAGA